MNAFASVVALYRCAGCPRVDSGVFEYAGPASSRLTGALRDCQEIPSHLGRFEADPEFRPDGSVYFAWMLAANEEARFYASVSELATSPRISKGVSPDNFYLVDEDYLAGEGNPPGSLLTLYAITTLIEALASLALSRTELTDGLNLVFVLPAAEGKKPRTINLVTRVRSDLLLVARPDVSLLLAIANPGNASLHAQEHQQLFRVAVADVLGEVAPEKEDFGLLVSSWPRVLKQYQFNADCYSHKFSFDKSRTEILGVEVGYIGMLSKVLGDSTTRALAVPLSLASLMLIAQTSSLLVGMLSTLAVLLVSVFIGGLMNHHLQEAQGIEASFNAVFPRLKEKVESTQDLAEVVRGAEANFGRRLKFSRLVIWTIWISAWLPTGGAVALFVWKHGAPA